MQADEAAEIVRCLDIHIEWTVDSSPDGRDLGEREVGGKVDGRGAELLEDTRGRRVRGREHDRDLGLHLLGQRASLLQLCEGREDAEIGDEDRAEAVLRGPPRVVQARDHLLLPVRHRRDRAPRRRPGRRRRAPARVRPCEQTHFHSGFGRQARHLVQLFVCVHEDARALRDAVDRHSPAAGLFEHSFEAARPLSAGDLDAVLGSVRKALLGRRQVVEVP